MSDDPAADARYAFLFSSFLLLLPFRHQCSCTCHMHLQPPHPPPILHTHTPSPSSQSTVLVGFGSATGNSEFIAKRIHSELQEKHGLKGVRLFALNDWKKLSDPTFEEYQAGVFVCATTGNGDAPENAEKFWRFLKRRTQPKNLLSKGMHFAVLGLGDTNYDKFCYMGKSMDTRLGEVGGRRVCKVGMADEAMGLEGTVEPWIDALYPALLKALGMEGQAAAAAVLSSYAARGGTVALAHCATWLHTQLISLCLPYVLVCRRFAQLVCDPASLCSS